MAKVKVPMQLSAPTHIGKLRITVTKTADGQMEYVQIMSGDQVTVNVVLIAQGIEIQDARASSAAVADARRGKR